MSWRHLPLTLVVAAALATPLAALHPGSELLLPAAARDELWTTDLWLSNPGSTAVAVELEWLVRDQPNPTPQSIALTLQPGHTEILEDVLASRFGLFDGAGALRIVADGEVVANSRIAARSGAATYGQGFEAIPVEAALVAGDSSVVVGLTANADFRSNIYALAGADGATLTFTLEDAEGVELATRDYTLGSFEPMLGNVLSELGSPLFDHATLVVAVSEGSVVAGASKVDQLSDDPTTLEGTWKLGQGSAEILPAGTYYGMVSTDRDRGAALTLDSAGNVVEIRFQMGSTQTGCNFFFPGGGVLPTPEPLSTLLGDEGFVFVNSYDGGGEIEWTLRLTEGAPYQYYFGTLSGVASGGPGSPSCNGDTGEAQVRLGKEPL